MRRRQSTHSTAQSDGACTEAASTFTATVKNNRILVAAAIKLPTRPLFVADAAAGETGCLKKRPPVAGNILAVLPQPSACAHCGSDRQRWRYRSKIQAVTNGSWLRDHRRS